MGAVQFNAVEAGFFGAYRAVAVFVDQIFHFVGGQLVRHFLHHRAGDGGGRHRRLADHGSGGLASGMVQLDEDLDVVFVHLVDQLFQARDERVVEDADFIADRLAQRVDGRHFHHDQAEAALGPGDVVIDEALRHVAVGQRVVGAHGGQHELVLEGHARQMTGGQQGGKAAKGFGGCHGVSLL